MNYQQIYGHPLAHPSGPQGLLPPSLLGNPLAMPPLTPQWFLPPPYGLFFPP